MNRRDFLYNGAALSTALNLKLAGHAAADTLGTGDDRKTLVCIFFGGGLDAYHVLIPNDATRYAEYERSRSNIARKLGDLIPLTEASGPSVAGETYGLAPSAMELAEMFNGTGDFAGKRRASWVGNVGTLIKPLTLDEFFNGTPGFDVPVGVGGHVRQVEQWQTTLPQGTINLRGWLGRTADLLRDGYNRERTTMNISLGGNNTTQLGENARPLSFTPFNGLGLSGRDVTDAQNPLAIKNMIHRRILNQTHNDYVDHTFSEISSLSLDQQISIDASLRSISDDDIPIAFPSSSFSTVMKSVLKLIATREEQGLCRQTIFVPAPGGWDDHFLLGDGFEGRMESTSKAIAAFQKNLESMGLADSVIGFTASEFARTLRSTGAGSDHAWGGPQMIFGKPIEGGKILGKFADLKLRGPDDTGRGGRMLPSTSCDEYFVDMLRWFGVEEDKLDIVLPNWANFTNRDPLGYLKT